MRIVLGVGGGIAAYKVASLLRLFTEAGHEVTVIPTDAAQRFVGTATWEALSGNRRGQHSIRINGQWRICFRWKDGEAEDVEICDYH